MSLPSYTVPGRVMVVLLAAIYALGFLVTPYWTKAPSTSSMILILAITLGIGIAWIVLSADELRLQVDFKKWVYLVLLAGVLLVPNVRTLTTDIPWRGDEEYHIAKALILAGTVPAQWMIAFVLALALLLYMAWRQSRWTIPAGLLLVAGVIAVYLVDNTWSEFRPGPLLRYPLISHWVFVLPPQLAILFGGSPYQEILFRIVPFCSVIALSWAYQNETAVRNRSIGLLWSLAIATIPLVFYYSTILYLELPAVFLMFVVCSRIDALLENPYPEIKRNPAWLALVLIGFVKETTLLLLALFLAWRWIALLKKGVSSGPDNPVIRRIPGEIRISVAVLLPGLWYLCLRSALSHQTRGVSTVLSTLWDITVYRTILLSFVEQFGPVFLLFLGGCFLLLAGKRYLSAGFFLSVMILYPLLHALDTRAFTGYSRFNLFLLAPILAASTIFIQRFADKKIAAVTTVAVILCLNLYMSPVNMDGTRKPLWGNYLTDTSEHYYPYREALRWLKENHGRDRILFTGMYYPYSFGFYSKQLDWIPDNRVSIIRREDVGVIKESETIRRQLEEAEKDNCTVVLYQVLEREAPSPDVGNYSIEKLFQNEAHTLVVYLRRDTRGNR